MAEAYDFRGIHEKCPTCGATWTLYPTGGPRFSSPCDGRVSRWWCGNCAAWTDKMAELATRFDEPKITTFVKTFSE